MRWRLHRGGIVNVWQYSVEEFDLSGGRAIFQGTNGSGKSRTLELLLPLCLDGDLHQIGSKGYDTVSMRRLMLDDYTGGPNRIGYAWVELRREADGREEYLTSGIGIKASATSQQINDSWRFVTEARVGHDFELVADGTPVGATQLRDILGADRMHDEEPFRATIAEQVYGIPAARYADLLHLQRTLRNPDVGLKVLEGQLEQILSDSLPPLDPAVVDQLAQSFEDLESIRDNIRGLSTADTALGRFLTGYAGYAYGALRTAGRRSAEAGKELAAARAEIARLTTRLRDEEAAAEKAEAEVATLEEREITLEGRIDDLKSSPLYDSVRDLADRKRVVSAARQAAVSALRQLRTQRDHTGQLVDSVLAELARFADDTAQAGELAATIRERMREAGLDPALSPAVPEVPALSATEVHETGRATLDPEAAPVELTRRVPPELDPDALHEALRAAAEQASRGASALGEHCAVTLSLVERARELAGEEQELGRRRQEARAAQLGATEAAGRRNESAQLLEDAAHTWHDAVSRWAAGIPATESGTEPAAELAPPPAAVLVADQDADPAGHRAGARLAARPAARAARGGRPHQSPRRRPGPPAGRGDRRADRAAVRRGHPTRTAGSFATAVRAPGGGRGVLPARRLRVRSLSDAARAGCEAALESCGLLTAWVTADGTLTDTGAPDLTAVGDVRATDGAGAERPCWSRRCRRTPRCRRRPWRGCWTASRSAPDAGAGHLDRRPVARRGAGRLDVQARRGVRRRGRAGGRPRAADRRPGGDRRPAHRRARRGRRGAHHRARAGRRVGAAHQLLPGRPHAAGRARHAARGHRGCRRRGRAGDRRARGAHRGGRPAPLAAGRADRPTRGPPASTRRWTPCSAPGPPRWTRGPRPSRWSPR